VLAVYLFRRIVGSSHLKMFKEREYIRVCVSLNKSPSETLGMLEEAYGNAAMKKTQVCDWHNHFNDGRSIASDDPCCGRPFTSTYYEKSSVYALLCSVAEDRMFRKFKRK
jgi:hypothetical protein